MGKNPSPTGIQSVRLIVNDRKFSARAVFFSHTKPTHSNNPRSYTIVSAPAEHTAGYPNWLFKTISLRHDVRTAVLCRGAAQHLAMASGVRCRRRSAALQPWHKGVVAGYVLYRQFTGGAGFSDFMKQSHNVTFASISTLQLLSNGCTNSLVVFGL